MPWFSLPEAENYNTASAAWAQLLSDPNNAPIYNSVQFGGPNECGGGIDRYCIRNDTPTDFFDSIAMRNMSLQCYNRAILWARNKDPADLAKTIEILEYWMVGPTTRMEPYLTTTTGAIGQYVFVPCYFAAYNLVKDQPGWTNKAAVEQWIVDFTAFLYPRRLFETFSNKVDWLTACMLAGAIVTNDTPLYELARDYFITLLNSRFLADGRVIDDYQRTTGLSYTMFALEAMSLSAEMIYRQSNGTLNLFQHDGYQLAMAYAAPYALDPGAWPWQQINTYTLDQNRAYEFANTRDPQPIYAQIIANATPFYVDTAAGHVTLTNSAASVLSAPAILSISSVTQSNGAGGVETVVSWSTDVQTTGTVTWGDSAAESSPAVLSPVLSTNHSVTLSPITEGVQYFFTIEALTDLSVAVSSSQSNFVAEIDNPPGPGTYTDELNTTTLDPQWTFTDPVGDSTLTKLSSGVLISVPGGGPSHDAWAGGNNSARITHPIPDEDFYMEFKVDSAVTQRYQSQGFVVELDDTNFIRFDFYSDGNGTNIHAGTIINDVAQNIILEAITSSTTLYMRVKRTGNVWEQSYSYNGANWTVSGSFTQAIGVVRAGLFAGNVGSSPIPAHTASFDYYRINQIPVASSSTLLFNQTSIGDQSVVSVLGTPIITAQVSALQQSPGDQSLFSVNSGQIISTAIFVNQTNPGDQSLFNVNSGQIISTDISANQTSPGDQSAVSASPVPQAFISADQQGVAGQQSAGVYVVPQSFISVLQQSPGDTSEVAVSKGIKSTITAAQSSPGDQMTVDMLSFIPAAEITALQQSTGDTSRTSVSMAVLIAADQVSPGDAQTIAFLSADGYPLGVITSSGASCGMFGMYTKKTECSESPYTIDWQALYTRLGLDADNHKITSSTWAVDSGAAGQQSVTGNKTTVVISGGVSGSIITAKNSIVINNGEYTDCATLYIRVF